MRCKACNVELRAFEATRKDPITGEFYDLCNECLKAINWSLFEDDTIAVVSMYRSVIK